MAWTPAWVGSPTTSRWWQHGSCQRPMPSASTAPLLIEGDPVPRFAWATGPVGFHNSSGLAGSSGAAPDMVYHGGALARPALLTFFFRWDAFAAPRGFCQGETRLRSEYDMITYSD